MNIANTFKLVDLEKLSSIAQDIAQVFFASMFVDYILGGRANGSVIFLGFFLAVLFWTFSLILVRFNNNK